MIPWRSKRGVPLTSSSTQTLSPTPTPVARKPPPGPKATPRGSRPSSRGPPTIIIQVPSGQKIVRVPPTPRVSSQPVQQTAKKYDKDKQSAEPKAQAVLLNQNQLKTGYQATKNDKAKENLAPKQSDGTPDGTPKRKKKVRRRHSRSYSESLHCRSFPLPFTAYLEPSTSRLGFSDDESYLTTTEDGQLMHRTRSAQDLRRTRTESFSKRSSAWDTSSDSDSSSVVKRVRRPKRPKKGLRHKSSSLRDLSGKTNDNKTDRASKTLDLSSSSKHGSSLTTTGINLHKIKPVGPEKQSPRCSENVTCDQSLPSRAEFQQRQKARRDSVKRTLPQTPVESKLKHQPDPFSSLHEHQHNPQKIEQRPHKIHPHQVDLNSSGTIHKEALKQHLQTSKKEGSRSPDRSSHHHRRSATEPYAKQISPRMAPTVKAAATVRPTMREATVPETSSSSTPRKVRESKIKEERVVVEDESPPPREDKPIPVKIIIKEGRKRKPKRPKSGGGRPKSSKGRRPPIVFSDPSALDMLEKFGGHQNESVKESALARQSLYVKFDPLVKGGSPVANKAGLPSRVPQVEAIAEQDDSDLLMMSTPPHNSTTPAPPPRSAKAGGLQHPARRALDAQLAGAGEDAVDRMLALSPANGSAPSSSNESSTVTLPPIPSEMTDSRELGAEPINQMSSSWLENVRFYSELEGDTALLNSADSVDCINWNTRDSGRPESPLQFDHEEIMGINTSSTTAVEGKSTNSTSPAKPNANDDASADDNDIIQVLKYSAVDMNRMRKEWELEFQARMLAKERDWLLKYDSLEEQKKQLHDDKENLIHSKESMKKVVAEYEQTIQKLMDEDLIRRPGKDEKCRRSSASQEEVTALAKERDQAMDDMRSVETAFSDLHRRYEKVKGMVETYRKNEETLKKAVADYQSKLKKQEERYLTLKKCAEEKLDKANEEVEKTRKASEVEVTRLKAAVKRSELQISSLEQQLEQKTQQNKDLSNICDELINKVG